MTVSDYTCKIKNICDSLSSIKVNIEEDEMVQVCLGGLAQHFDLIRMKIWARENPPSFVKLQSMLFVEENHVRTKSKTSERHMFFSNSEGSRRRGRDGSVVLLAGLEPEQQPIQPEVGGDTCKERGTEGEAPLDTIEQTLLDILEED